MGLRGKKRTVPICHPDRECHGLGLCSMCYRRYIRTTSENYKLNEKLQRQAKNDWFKEHKATLKCERCPENHPACLQFHHRDGDEKEGEVGRMVRQGYSISAILEEMAKCEVLCANCHAKETYERLQGNVSQAK